MEKNTETTAMKESSEVPELQKQSEEVGKDEEHLQHQTSAQQQSTESHSPSKTCTDMSELHPVLHGMLISPKKQTAKQTSVESDDDPSTSKPAQPHQPLERSSSSQSLQGEKRRSEELLEQHLQSKQSRLPEEPKEEKKQAEEKKEDGEKDSEGKEG